MWDTGPVSVNGIAVGGAFTPSSSQSAAFLARATDVTSITDKTNYDNLITGLVNDGVWAKLDCLYILAAIDVTTAKLNLVGSSFSLVSHGTNIDTSGFSAYVGYTGNGSDRYLDTQFVAFTAAGNYSQDSASFGCYVISNVAGDNSVTIGAIDATSTNLADMLTRQAAGNYLDRLNSQGASSLSFTNATRAGMYASSRTTNQARAAYKNGTQQNTAGDSSQSILTLPAFAVLARNNNGTIDAFAADQVSTAFLGGALSSTDAANLSSRINTYMTAYGINVY